MDIEEIFNGIAIENYLSLWKRQKKKNRNQSRRDFRNTGKGKGLNIKVLLFGIPIFIVQLVVVYFITANVLLNKIQTNHSSAEPSMLKLKEAEHPKANSQELGKFVYMVEDLVINPANTEEILYLRSGLMFLLSKNIKNLNRKSFYLRRGYFHHEQQRDAQLSNIVYRDTLRRNYKTSFSGNAES